MKKMLLISFLILFPAGVFAKGQWKVIERKNIISIEGQCVKTEIAIEMYEIGKGEPIYTSNAVCMDGKFNFSDNLLQWKNLKDGKYELVIDHDLKNIEQIEIKKPIEQKQENAKKNEKSNVAEVVLSPQNKFLSAFVSLQQSILDMRQWLSETNYPSVVKSSIKFGLDGVDLAVGKISDMILSGENEENVIENNEITIEPIADSAEIQKGAEVSKIPIKQTVDDSIAVSKEIVADETSENSIGEISQ